MLGQAGKGESVMSRNNNEAIRVEPAGLFLASASRLYSIHIR